MPHYIVWWWSWVFKAQLWYNLHVKFITSLLIIIEKFHLFSAINQHYSVIINFDQSFKELITIIYCYMILNWLSSFSYKCKISYFWFSGVSFSSKFSGMLCEHLLTGHNFSASVVWTMILKHSSLQILCPHGIKTGGEESKSLSQLAHLPNFLQYDHALRIIIMTK